MVILWLICVVGELVDVHFVISVTLRILNDVTKNTAVKADVGFGYLNEIVLLMSPLMNS